MERLVGSEGGRVVRRIERRIDLQLQRLKLSHRLLGEAFGCKPRRQSLEHQSDRCHLIERSQCQRRDNDGLWSDIDEASLANKPHDRISRRGSADTQRLSYRPHRELLAS